MLSTLVWRKAEWRIEMEMKYESKIDMFMIRHCTAKWSQVEVQTTAMTV